MANLLNAENIRGVYYTPSGQEVVGVDNVSVQMVEGEVLGLAGESGSGKSTLGLDHLADRSTALDRRARLIGHRRRGAGPLATWTASRGPGGVRWSRCCPRGP